MSVQSRSDGVNTSLFEKREHIEKLHWTRNFFVKFRVFSDSESIQARAEAVMLLKQLNYPFNYMLNQIRCGLVKMHDS
nr:vacuolar protein sorting-associated protein 51 homolog isoform X2 [Ipomoea batatas]